MTDWREDPDVIPVRFSRELLEQLVTRDNDGNRLHLAIGQRQRDGFYVPTVTTDLEDNPWRAQEVACACGSSRLPAALPSSDPESADLQEVPE